MTSEVDRNSSDVRMRPSWRRASSGTPIRSCCGARASSRRSASVSAKNTERGNSRSRTRKAAARSSLSRPRWLRMNACCAPQLDSTTDHGAPPRGSPPVATSRAVMSARSRLRPSTRKCQPSSCDHRRVGDAGRPARRARAPTTGAARWRRVRPKPCHRCQVVLMPSHSSVESVSRARRAFSRAANQRAGDRARVASGRRRARALTSANPASPSNGIPMIREHGARGDGLVGAGVLEQLQGQHVEDAGGVRRRARRSGRSRTATRRSGSARAAPPPRPRGLLLLLLLLAHAVLVGCRGRRS